MPGPLDGVRVLELGAVITAPLATMILADQGAEVVKVEPPGIGDVMRFLGTARGGVSALFAGCNRGKRSIALDLKHETARDVVRRLAARADVVVQNYRPGVVERLGLDEPTLRAQKPDLVYVSISAFGEEGPDAARPAYDHILQGVAGVAWMQGDGVHPQYVKSPICDKTTAYTAAQGITAALLARARSGRGQHVRLSMLDATLSFTWPDGMANHTILEDDVVPLPPITASYQNVQTLDGYVAVAAVTDAQWHGIFRAIERPELVEDERFATAEARTRNLLELLGELGGGKVDYTTAEAVERLQAQDVPCGPVLTLAEVAEHPQTRAMGSLVEDRHPTMGRLRQPRPPLRFSDTPASIRRHAPLLGEHTDEVLAEAGLGPDEIRSLRQAGAAA